MNGMDPASCSRSIIVCENSIGSVLEAHDVKGQTSDFVSKKVLTEEEPQKNIATPAVQVEVEDDVTAKGKEFHVVDLSGGGESENGQIICRICHFGPVQSPDRVSGKSVSPDLIEIGCKCKNELGLAHFHCAEAWFKLKGNSVCEVCGCTAKNVTVRLIEESQERDITLGERRDIEEDNLAAS